MREVRGRRGGVHKFLADEKVKKAFLQNIKDEKHSTSSVYNDGKSDEENSLKWTLKQIYFQKCAFCESYIKNEVGDIEHFRPKNSSENQAKKCDKTYSYYWLAFSWDNLLPCCSKCNGKKSNCFDIEGERVEYNNETLDNLHYTLEVSNKIEKPKLLHPEYDKFEHDIQFTKDGEIESSNSRVNYTISICDLNRTNLKNSRRMIMMNFMEKIHKHLKSFVNNLNEDESNFDECLEYFKVTIEDFVKESNIEYEYSLIRKSIHDNFEQFLEIIDIDYEDEAFAKEIIFVAFLTFSENERD